MKKNIFLAAVALLVAPSLVGAAQVVYPNEQETSITIGPGSYEDLYVAGESVTVDSVISGDLFVAGGAVTISERTEGDLFAAGGNLVLIGAVIGDARLAGGNVTILSPISEDLLIAGGTVLLTGESSVAGDFWAVGGTVVVNAPISGDVKISADSVQINSSITGAVDIRAERLVFGAGAQVAGEISYRGYREAVVAAGADVSEISFKKIEHQSRRTALTAGLLISLLAVFLAVLLVLRFFGATAQHVVDTAYHKTWKSLGIGVAGFVITPIVIALLLLSAIGFYIGLLVMAWFMVALLLLGLLSALFIGALVLKWLKRLNKNSSLVLSWQSAVLGVLVLFVLKIIPVLGWAVVVLVMAMVFGAILQTIGHQIKTVHMRR
ncbi:MAG: hypothetical protein COU11_02080 [Candidatus Harrisonbacteria bacterium CG10_big_fil_rev_8_21_14_0_10_49_15]|uniref:Polymer-forming cytoskeletal protein n=1 Tax=Candidatus Harrisonbacteria bacterium CG10_big_fil_rev_8_21_14_0_10_49_15 TaxID=1974587 RepID=A0A2H0UKR3_9BACT|nr:MAG: hypothetical protein COU11_02080 [Candidatus Harrisonbacteria bacterium CG10_big_fil_rev_8_21_14_0_10_49_15]